MLYVKAEDNRIIVTDERDRESEPIALIDESALLLIASLLSNSYAVR